MRCNFNSHSGHRQEILGDGQSFSHHPDDRARYIAIVLPWAAEVWPPYFSAGYLSSAEVAHLGLRLAHAWYRRASMGIAGGQLSTFCRGVFAAQPNRGMVSLTLGLASYLFAEAFWNSSLVPDCAGARFRLVFFDGVVTVSGAF